MIIFREILFLTCMTLAFVDVNANRFDNLDYNKDIYIVGNTIYNEKVYCRMIIIKPEVYLTSASCIQQALNETPNQRISTFGPVDSVPINVSNIYYNENFGSTYNPLKRDIAMVVLSQRIMRSLSMFTLPTKGDIDYSSCYNPIRKRSFSCNNAFCTDTEMIYPGDPIVCSSRGDPNAAVLAGFKVSQSTKMQNNIVIVKTDISDLKDKIETKLQSLGQ